MPISLAYSGSSAGPELALGDGDPLRAQKATNISTERRPARTPRLFIPSAPLDGEGSDVFGGLCGSNTFPITENDHVVAGG